MSRIGKVPVQLIKGVKAKISDGLLLIEGTKGRLDFSIPKGIEVKVTEDKINVYRQDDTKEMKSLHGTVRALINNMVKGVSEGYKKELDIIGTGYKAQAKGTSLILNLGFSHPVEIKIPTELKVLVPNPNRIVIEGLDKQKVASLAAYIRKIYPPEPYQGKGIRYVGEEVRRKLGKALAAKA